MLNLNSETLILSKARFTLGVRAEKTWGNSELFVLFLSGPKLLINATTLATRVANWLPKFDGIPFL